MDHLNYLTLSQLIERNIAWRQHNHQAGQELSLLWVPGFRSTMSGQKVSFMKEYCTRENLGLTLFDYSGHGQSSGDFVKSSISLWLDDLMNIITQVTKGPIIIVASSMGGWISLLALNQLAKNDPASLGRIKGLMTIAPAIDLTQKVMLQRFTQDMLETLKTEGVVMVPSRYDDEDYPITQHMLDDGNKHLLLETPYELPCPLRIIHGMQDEDVPFEGSVAFLKQVRPLEANAHLTLVKDAAHRLSRPQDLDLLAANIDELRQLILRPDTI